MCRCRESEDKTSASDPESAKLNTSIIYTIGEICARDARARLEWRQDGAVSGWGGVPAASASEVKVHKEDARRPGGPLLQSDDKQDARIPAPPSRVSEEFLSPRFFRDDSFHAPKDHLLS
ncbi:hypothetical protein J6590_063840 [Homalodisca vitripennis]|nr:hypothetical protein J6590_063840 [Homalodisca vitripennis]